MAFWSSQTLEQRLSSLVVSSQTPVIDCNSIELTVGREVYVTPSLDDVLTTTKQQLQPEQGFQIPPGQFAFVLTEESVNVPRDAMAFISMKATFKMKGLINVSGFHVDPGWSGPLVFAVFNAGPAPVHLNRGLALFLIWYADLDQPSEKMKTKPGEKLISPNLINSITGGNDTLYALDQRLKETVEKLKAEDKDLDRRIHKLSNAQTRISVLITVLLTIAVGLVGFAFRESIVAAVVSRSLPDQVTSSAAPPAAASNPTSP